MADLEKKTSSFIEELSHYSTSNVKCHDCRNKMKIILELLHSLPPKKEICEHCKETAYSCKQCEMLLKMVDKNKIYEYKKIERRFSEWVHKIKNSLRELIECKSLCKHGTFEEPMTQFLKFVEPATSKRNLNVESLPPRAHVNLISDAVTGKQDMRRGTTHSLPDKLTEEAEFNKKSGSTYTSLETMIQEWQTKKRSFGRRGVIDMYTKAQYKEKCVEARDDDTKDYYLNERFLADASLDMTTRSKDIKELKFGRKSTSRTLFDYSKRDDDIEERFLNSRFAADPSLSMMTRRTTEIEELKLDRIIIPRALSENLGRNKYTDERDLAKTVNVLSDNLITFKDFNEHIFQDTLACRNKMIDGSKAHDIDKSGITEVLRDKIFNNMDQEKYHFLRDVDAPLNITAFINDKQELEPGRISLPQASLENLITFQHNKQRDLGERSIAWLEKLTKDKLSDNREFGRKSVNNESFVNLTKDKYTEEHDFDRLDVVNALLDNWTVWFKDNEELELYGKGIIYDLLENLPQDKKMDKGFEKKALKIKELSWLVNLIKNMHKVHDLNRTVNAGSSLQMLNTGIDTEKRELSLKNVLLPALSDNPIRYKDIEELNLETSALLVNDTTESYPNVHSDDSYSLLDMLTKKLSLSRKVVTYASEDTLAAYKRLEVQDLSKSGNKLDLSDKYIKEPNLETNALLVKDVTESNPIVHRDSSYSLLDKLTKKQRLSTKNVTYASEGTLAAYKQLEVQDFSQAGDNVDFLDSMNKNIKAKEDNFRDNSTTHTVQNGFHGKSKAHSFPENIIKGNSSKIHIEINLNHAPPGNASTEKQTEDHSWGRKSENFFVSSSSLNNENEETEFGYSASTSKKPDNQIKKNDIEDIKDFGKTNNTHGFQENMDTEHGVMHDIEEDDLAQDKPIQKFKEVGSNIPEKVRRVSTFKGRQSKTKHNVLDNVGLDKKDTSESTARRKTVLIITSSSKTFNKKPIESQKDVIKSARDSTVDYQKLLVRTKENTGNRKKSVQIGGTDEKMKKDEAEIIKQKDNAKGQEKTSLEKDKLNKTEKSFKFSTSEGDNRDANKPIEISLRKSIDILKKESKTKQDKKATKQKKNTKKLPSEDEMYQRMQSGTQHHFTLKQVLLRKDKTAKIAIVPQKSVAKSFSLLPDPMRLESYRNKQKENDVFSAESAGSIDSAQVLVECEDAERVVSDAMIIGDAIVPHDPAFIYNTQQEGAKPLLYRTNAPLPPVLAYERPSSHTFGQDEDNSADMVTIRYSLSDKQYIQKGWTQLPSVKKMRRVIIYRMAPVHPELNWFLRNKENKTAFYDTGEILAEIDSHGFGKLFYKNGLVALDYHKSRDSGGKFKYIIYSDHIDQKVKMQSPPGLLAWFDHLGNALINDQSGNLRLQYNQFEGCVRDSKIGPPCKWKWHTLNDPPALENQATEQYEQIDQFVKDLGRRVSHYSRSLSTIQTSSSRSSRSSSIRIRSDEDERKAKQEYQAMIDQEVINLLKRQKKRVYRSLLIKSKTVKMSDSWSLYVIDQEHVYLRFRHEGASFKFNLGLKLMSNSVLGLTQVEFSDTVVGVLSVPDHLLH